MNKIEFFTLLEEALQDKHIRSKIREITVEQQEVLKTDGDFNKVANELNKEKKRTAQYEQKIEAYQEEIKEVVYKNNVLESENSALKKKVEMLEKDNRKATEYIYNFSEVHQYYTKYMSLDQSIHLALENVIKRDNAISFLCSGTQWDNLEPLWEFISYKLDTYSEEELETLIEVFHYFFEQYNQITKRYVLLEVHVGETFDEDFHTRASNSQVVGQISRVLLQGFKNIKTDKIIKKSIVRV